MVDGKKKDSVTSGAGGEFAIRDFPAGTYSLKISRSGYKRWERTGLAVLATDLNLGTVKLEAKSVLPPEPSIGAMSGRVLDSDTDVVAATNLLRLLNPDSVKAPYPRAALSDRISGNVKVRVTVVQGRVTDVTVLQAVHPLLDSAAVIAARKGEYRGSGVEKRTYQFLHPGIR